MTTEEILRHNAKATAGTYLKACKSLELTGSDEDEVWVEEARAAYEDAEQALADFLREKE